MGSIRHRMRIGGEVAMPGGRPTKYEPKFADEAKKLCELGARDVDIAEFFDVCVRTIYRWQSEHPEFCHALKIAKEEADNRVERALYQRALGYTIKEGDNEKHVPPDTTAAIFWLKNRKKDEWRDVRHNDNRNEHDLSDPMLDLLARLQNKSVFPGSDDSD